jgi:hypothetical protein
MKLAVDAGGEVANGAEGDFQFFGDFFMEVSFGEELQDFLLAWGERVSGPDGAAPLPIVSMGFGSEPKVR